MRSVPGGCSRGRRVCVWPGIECQPQTRRKPSASLSLPRCLLAGHGRPREPCCARLCLGKRVDAPACLPLFPFRHKHRRRRRPPHHLPPAPLSISRAPVQLAVCSRRRGKGVLGHTASVLRACDRDGRRHAHAERNSAMQCAPPTPSLCALAAGRAAGFGRQRKVLSFP